MDDRERRGAPCIGRRSPARSALHPLTAVALPTIIALRYDVANRALRAIVRGRVQGVGYRAFVLREAHALGLHGYARNMRDGRVEVVAVGDDTGLQQLVQRLFVGPPLAQVEGIERTPIDPPPDVDRFEVRG